MSDSRIVAAGDAVTVVWRSTIDGARQDGGLRPARHLLHLERTIRSRYRGGRTDPDGDSAERQAVDRAEGHPENSGSGEEPPSDSGSVGEPVHPETAPIPMMIQKETANARNEQGFGTTWHVHTARHERRAVSVKIGAFLPSRLPRGYRFERALTDPRVGCDGRCHSRGAGLTRLLVDDALDLRSLFIRVAAPSRD